jgi:hypothetical protein
LMLFTNEFFVDEGFFFAADFRVVCLVFDFLAVDFLAVFFAITFAFLSNTSRMKPNVPRRI